MLKIHTATDLAVLTAVKFAAIYYACLAAYEGRKNDTISYHLMPAPQSAIMRWRNFRDARNRGKKTLLTVPQAVPPARSRSIKVFFASFLFTKKKCLLPLPCPSDHAHHRPGSLAARLRLR